MSEDKGFEEIEKKFFEFLNVIKPIKWENWVKLFQLAEKNGFHILKTGFYSTIPTVSELSDNVFKKKENLHIDWNEKEQINLLHELEKFSLEFQQLINENKYDLHAKAFSWHDSPVYYSLIRHFKPEHIIEVGGGNSTILAYYASLKNQNTSVTVIDPFLKESFKNKFPSSIKLIEKPVQNVPLHTFETLSKNDILFIDSTHVSKIGSDVNFLILEVLPILQSGVLVHFHDIHLPTYPKKWLTDKLVFWNEQFLLHAFLIGNNNFEISFGVAYMGISHPELMKDFFDTKGVPGGGSFWLRRK